MLFNIQTKSFLSSRPDPKVWIAGSWNMPAGDSRVGLAFSTVAECLRSSGSFWGKVGFGSWVQFTAVWHHGFGPEVRLNSTAQCAARQSCTSPSIREAKRGELPVSPSRHTPRAYLQFSRFCSLLTVLSDRYQTFSSRAFRAHSRSKHHQDPAVQRRVLQWRQRLP